MDPACIPLPNRGVLALSGENVHGFLQGLLSNDLERVRRGEAVYAALLTPQGKFLHDVFVVECAGAVCLDGEADRLDEALSRSRLDTGQPAFFSWLGTTYYLTKDAIRETLGCIAAVAAPGSRLVLDYKLARHLIPEQSLPLNDKLERLVKRLGEPMLSAFAPEELKAEMARIGLAELESLLPQAQAQRYLPDRSDIVEPPPNFAFALFGC